MMYLHSSFDLADDISLADYQSALSKFAEAMKSRDLIVAVGPILERCPHPIMDTDDDRRHRYFFVISFTDRKQCDAAVEHIQAADPQTDPVHRAIYSNIMNPIFSCWVDSA